MVLCEPLMGYGIVALVLAPTAGLKIGGFQGMTLVGAVGGVLMALAAFGVGC